MDDPDAKLLVLLLLLAGVAGAFWYFRDDILPLVEEPVVIQPEPVVDAVQAQGGPLHPLALSRPASLLEHKLVPLPPLDDSDSYFLLALVDTFGPGIERMLVNEGLVDKFVATVDNLTRKQVAEKIRPVGRLSKSFKADPAGADSYFYLSPDNYHRYAFLVTLIARAEPEVVVEMYGRFYPLFQRSYERLGYPNAYFNDRVVEVIDHLLATPEADEPVLLVRPNVLYEFADAEFEALSSGQKLLLRMGGKNAATIKRELQSLRALIARSPD